LVASKEKTMPLCVFLYVLQAGLGAARLDTVHVPNDPLFVHQLSFSSPGGPAFLPRRSTRPGGDSVTIAAGITLDAPRAWALTTGSRAVTVALLDDGFFYRHEDIAENVWRNAGESGVDQNGYSRETNGLDDDGNGFVDDLHGWDFVFDDPDPDPYVFDGMDRSRIQPYWHSISALGIIGARGDNGIGVAGINWDVSLMLLKIGAQGVRRDEVDAGRVTRAARAIRYAVDNGARIINWSGFVGLADSARLVPLREAVRYAAEHGVLLVTAAGNDGKNLDQDENCLYPQCFDFPNQIRVGQLGFDGALYRYQVQGQSRGSNFGARRVEIAALGEHSPRPSSMP
jgi:thermitase